MEAAIANLIEPGETIVVGNKGIWGQRVCDLAERYGGAHLTHVVAPVHELLRWSCMYTPTTVDRIGHC